MGTPQSFPLETKAGGILLRYEPFQVRYWMAISAGSWPKRDVSVLRSDGSILWYDFHVNNPRNPDVRRVTNNDIRDLFSGCSVELHRITLAPSRGSERWRVFRFYIGLCQKHLFSALTHSLGWITPKMRTAKVMQVPFSSR